MKVIFANGTELNPILVTGEKRTVHGMSRDTLRFVFNADAGMAVLDEAFTEAACESITIDNGNESYIHKGYTIRAELKKSAEEIVKATADTDSVYEDRIVVSMSQRTYTETQLAEQKALLKTLLGG